MRYTTADMFGQILYSPKLSYEELYEMEDIVRESLKDALTRAGAHFVNFEARGDALHVHCKFDDFDEDLAHGICDEIAVQMDGNLEGRLLFVRRDFSVMGFYAIALGAWQEGMIQPPFAGAIGVGLAKQLLTTKRLGQDR